MFEPFGGLWRKRVKWSFSWVVVLTLLFLRWRRVWWFPQLVWLYWARGVWNYPQTWCRFDVVALPPPLSFLWHLHVRLASWKWYGSAECGLASVELSISLIAWRSSLQRWMCPVCSFALYEHRIKGMYTVLSCGCWRQQLSGDPPRTTASPTVDSSSCCRWGDVGWPCELELCFFAVVLMRGFLGSCSCCFFKVEGAFPSGWSRQLICSLRSYLLSGPSLLSWRPVLVLGPICFF